MSAFVINISDIKEAISRSIPFVPPQYTVRSMDFRDANANGLDDRDEPKVIIAPSQSGKIEKKAFPIGGVVLAAAAIMLLMKSRR